MHSCKNGSQTLQENVLFDADRLDRVRLNKLIKKKYFSEYAQEDFNGLLDVANKFLINKFFSKMSVLMNHSKAINFFMFLCENLEFLQTDVVYHGSPFQNLTNLEPSVRYENDESNNFVKDAKLLFFTKDWYWVIHRSLTRSMEIFPDKNVHNFSVYSIKKENSQNLICSDGRIEYVRIDPISDFDEIKFTLPKDTTYEQVVSTYEKSNLQDF